MPTPCTPARRHPARTGAVLLTVALLGGACAPAAGSASHAAPPAPAATTPQAVSTEIIPLDISDCVDLDHDGDELDVWCSEPVATGRTPFACPDGSPGTTPTKIHTRPAGQRAWNEWRLHTGPCGEVIAPAPND